MEEVVLVDVVAFCWSLSVLAQWASSVARVWLTFPHLLPLFWHLPVPLALFQRISPALSRHHREGALDDRQKKAKPLYDTPKPAANET